MSAPTLPMVQAELVHGLYGPRYRVPRCPYCRGVHHHGAEDGERAAHCYPGGQYQLIGPTSLAATAPGGA